MHIRILQILVKKRHKYPVLLNILLILKLQNFEFGPNIIVHLVKNGQLNIKLYFI